MKTILVDDDLMGMEGFEIECGKLQELEIVGKFTSPLKALDYAKHHPVDFALLDIDMPCMNGFELYDALKALSPEMIIVFVTAHPSYAVKAIRKKIDYIVFKPYDQAEIIDVLERVRLLKQRLKKSVFCHTFGRFDIFVNGNPIIFKSAKAKEILAFCIYRNGAPVTAGEIIDKLWEDYTGTVGDCSIFRYTIKQLMDTLKKYHAEAIFGREKGLCYIKKDYLSCDYYDYLDDVPQSKELFRGEFMTEYSWAENAIYTLQLKAKDKLTNG